MKILNVPFNTVDWDNVETEEHPGKTGTAYWKKMEMGNVRVRMVEYSAGYFADHWCNRGHILLCLEGELETELQDGRCFTLTPGTSYHVSDDIAPHRSHTKKGAKLFIVD